jgi:formylmethanofuran dehydrogenase subunit E
MAQRLSGMMKTREAHNAQQRVHDALDRGEIKKPAKCSRCGKQTSQLEFSHNGYKGRLDGKWLCTACHHKEDRKSPNGGGNGAAGTERA